jgi:hypothetical protein
VSSTASEFARTLLAPNIAEEIQTVYQRAKKTLNLRRRDASTESSEGEGNLDTPIFRYVVFGRQDQSEAANYQIVRELELRNGAESQQEEPAWIMHDGEGLRDGCGKKRAIHVANRHWNELRFGSALRHSRHERQYAASL